MRWDRAAELIHTEFVPWAIWTTPIAESKVALVATAGVYMKKGMHQPYLEEHSDGDPTFREFPAVVDYEDLELTRAPYDHTFARQDLNVVFPLERLKALAAQGYIGSAAPFAYSFAGHILRPVSLLANYAPSVAYRMKRMGADVAVVVATGSVAHQTASLVARAIELAGVPTLVIGTNREVLEAVRPPRAVVVRHPDSSPLGNPGNAGKHQHLLREALETAWQFGSPGLIADLPFSWSGE